MVATGRTESGVENVWAERDQWVPRGVATYTHVVVDHAHGAEIWDVDGRRYIDFAGGIGTLNVGHTPAPVVEAIRDQAEKLIHSCFSVAIYEPYVELARRLAQSMPGDFAKKTMFVNSGAEAVENAIKIARAATGRPNVIAFHNAFHGRTLLGMTLTGKERPYRVGGPFAPGVFHGEFPYAYRCSHEDCYHNGGSRRPCRVETGEDLERMLSEEVAASTVAAIIVEPVQGEGGFVVAPTGFVRRLREICDREGIVLIADEVQTGFGRTGSLFAMEQMGVDADIVTLAKSIAAGMPLGAIVGKAEIMDAPGPGGIGGTFGGNPMALRAGLAVLGMFEDGDMLARARHVGRLAMERFQQLQERYDLVGDVRGLGPMLAIELVRDRETREPAPEETAEIIHRCHDSGLIVIKAGFYDNVIRLLVPFVVTDAQLEEGLDILERELAAVNAAMPVHETVTPGEGA